jgi:hypothetical protein
MVPPNGVSWRDWVDARFDAVDKQIQLAKADLERRLESMNEFRAQMDRQADTFMSAERYESCHGRLVDQIAVLEKAQAQAEARGKVYSTIVAAIISIVVGIVVHYLSGK